MNNLKHLIAAVMNAAASRLRQLAPAHLLPQFAGQHTNARKNERRQIKRAMGARQARKRKLLGKDTADTATTEEI